MMGRRVTHSVVDELGMDALRDGSFEAILAIREYETYVVGEDDKYNLPLIAQRKYSDPDYWWCILIYNGIPDAFMVKPGTRLKIPMYHDVMDALTDNVNVLTETNEIQEL